MYYSDDQSNVQEVNILSNLQNHKMLQSITFFECPLESKFLFGGLKYRQKIEHAVPSLIRISYMSWSYSFFILHSASKIPSVLNLDRKSSMQEKLLGFKSINYFFSQWD